MSKIALPRVERAGGACVCMDAFTANITCSLACSTVAHMCALLRMTFHVHTLNLRAPQGLCMSVAQPGHARVW